MATRGIGKPVAIIAGSVKDQSAVHAFNPDPPLSLIARLGTGWRHGRDHHPKRTDNHQDHKGRANERCLEKGAELPVGMNGLGGHAVMSCVDHDGKLSALYPSHA